MTTSESFQALRRANPRAQEGFERSVDAVADAVRLRLVTATDEPRPSRPRRRLVRVSAAGVSLVVVVAVAAFLTVGSSGDGPGVESAAAAVTKAATLTAASAERSGTVVVRMTHNGKPWAGKTVRWNAADVSIADDPSPLRPAKSELRVVDGTLYSLDPDGWMLLGDPKSIDPDSGTTPDEYLTAVVTLRRIARAMTNVTTRRLKNGFTVFSGTVAAGLIARETGFKEGQSIRVLPFGYVAHDQAADPAAGLATAVTIGPEGVVREIAVKWGTGASAWTYTVAYSHLGATPAPVAPANARSLLKERGLE